MINPKSRPKEIAEIGWKFARIWTRFYLCVGFLKGTGKEKIECYECDSQMNILKTETIGMDFPLRVWNKNENFEILKK